MKWVLTMIAVSLGVGCVSKNQIPAPDAAMVERSGQSLEILQQGHAIYMIQCGRCHEPMMPSEVSSADWHIVVPGMAWNAGISQGDEDAVLRYIMAAR